MKFRSGICQVITVSVHATYCKRAKIMNKTNKTATIKPPKNTNPAAPTTMLPVIRGAKIIAPNINNPISQAI